MQIYLRLCGSDDAVLATTHLQPHHSVEDVVDYYLTHGSAGCPINKVDLVRDLLLLVDQNETSNLI